MLDAACRPMRGCAASAPAGPPGWPVNPSAPGQRAPVVAVGLAGLAVSIASATPSLGFGFVGVTIGALVGGRDRWRRRPAVVLGLDAAAAFVATSAVARWSASYVAKGTTSVGALLATALAVAMLPLIAAEAQASLARALARCEVSRVLVSDRLGARASTLAGYASGAGAIAVGAWLLVVPASVACPLSAAHAHSVGAWTIVIGAQSLSRVARGVRWLNATVGGWLLCAPLLYGYELRGSMHSIIVGITLLVLSVVLAAPEDE